MNRLARLVSLLAVSACAPAHVDAAGPRERTAVDPAAAPAADRFEWHGEVATGLSVAVENVSGDVVVTRGKDRTLRVHAVKRGRDADEVRIEVRSGAAGVEIETIHPRGSKRGLDVEVDYRIELPDGLAFSADVVNGSIDTGSASDRVELNAVNGDIRAAGAHQVDAATVNGKLVVDWPGGGTGHASLESVNGTLELRLPADTDGRLEISTLQGEIRSDVPLSRSGELVGGHATAVLGKGTAAFALATVNGSIRIARR